MRFPSKSEIRTEWQIQYPWGDDKRHHFNKRRKKSNIYGYVKRFNTMIDLIQKHVPKGARILDLGSAQCNYALTLAELGYKVTAVDINEEFLEYAKMKYEFGEIEFVALSFMDFKRKDSFDCVLCGEIIEHLAYPKDLLTLANYNLREKGFLFLSTPDGNEFGSTLQTFSQIECFDVFEGKQFHWGDHTFLFTEKELRSLGCESGFKTIYSKGIISQYSTQIKAIRYLLPFKLLEMIDDLTSTWKKSGKSCTANLIHGYQKEVFMEPTNKAIIPR